MCNPAAAVAVASLLITTQEQKKSAKRQQKAIDEAAASSNVQASLEQNQIYSNAADELTLRQRQALRERAQVRAATGEAGIQGGSVDRVENEVDANKGFDIARIISNTGNRISQSHRAALGRNAGYRSDAARIVRPSNAATGLQIAGEIYQAKS